MPVLPAPLDFDAFFAAEYPRLVNIAVALCGTRAAAEDVAQEAMARAYQRWDRIAAYDQPAAWVRRVALNLASSRRRRGRSEAVMLDRLRLRASHVPEVDVGSGPADPLWVQVRALPRAQRAAVVLHYVDELSLAEVATVLGSSVGSVKTHLHRARARLRRAVEVERERGAP